MAFLLRYRAWLSSTNSILFTRLKFHGCALSMVHVHQRFPFATPLLIVTIAVSLWLCLDLRWLPNLVFIQFVFLLEGKYCSAFFAVVLPFLSFLKMVKRMQIFFLFSLLEPLIFRVNIYLSFFLISRFKSADNNKVKTKLLILFLLWIFLRTKTKTFPTYNTFLLLTFCRSGIVLNKMKSFFNWKRSDIIIVEILFFLFFTKTFYR